jgi:very-short-patch-repair endonuclease
MRGRKINLDEMQAQMARRGEFVTPAMTLTKAEDQMARLLINSGIKITPQFEIDGRSFDFRVLEYPILIEVDGGIHATLEKRLNDYRKDRYVTRRGWKVFRYANSEVKDDKNYLIAKEIKNMIEHTHSCPKLTIYIREDFWSYIKRKIFGKK